MNKSSDDFESFQFGVTLSPEDRVIYTTALAKNRHHQIKQITPATLSDPKSEIDFILHPFNRGDTYSLRLLVKIPEDKESPGEIELSSPEPVSFISLPTIAEVVEEAASRASLSLGIFQISFTK